MSAATLNLLLKETATADLTTRWDQDLTETDIDLAYDFIAAVDGVSRGGEKGMEILKAHLAKNPKRLLRVRLSRSAMMHLRRKEIVEMADIIDTKVREKSMRFIHRRGVEFERAVEQGVLELGDTLLHIAARRGIWTCVCT